MRKAKLYIVVCIDAEGPVNYASDTWDKVEGAMARIISNDFRYRFPDSNQGGLRPSYFILDWVGFNQDPTDRKPGFGTIYEHYTERLLPTMAKGDYDVYWHYHHPYSDGKWRKGGWNRDWSDNNEYENQINRLIIDREWFPSVYRAGGTIETNEQSRWLEEWIPFDFSSRAPHPSIDYYMRNLKHIIRGRFRSPLWDWSKAPSDWGFYKPSLDNYQTPGSMKRIIFRCLDIKSAAHQLGEMDIRRAFLKARDERAAVCSFFTHDFYVGADDEVAGALGMISKVSSEFADVDYEYQTALSAAQLLLFGGKNLPRLELALEYTDGILRIRSNEPLFSQKPWVVTKNNEGTYKRIEAEPVDSLLWHSIVDKNSTQAVGAAASDEMGNTDVKTIDITRSGL